MTAFPDHYAALGIDPTADQEVIGAAYRALAKKYHPDTGATTGTASAERFAEIQQAYEVLGSAESRSRYDVELLEATQRELDEHLAKKQRKIAGATGAPPPPPDLGTIRPERRGGKPTAWNLAINLKEMGPFLVVSGLLMAVAGGLASLYLSNAPLPPVEEPPLPQISSGPEPAPELASVSSPAPSPAAAPEPPQQQAALPEQPPLFGTSMMDEPALSSVPEADAEAAALPSPPPAAPVPKARPQNVAAAKPPPVQTEARARRFTAVIYEKYRTGDTIQEEAGVVFASEARCAAFGERAVLRRLAPFEGQRLRPRIWYECIEAP
jgi:hypothetical protein